MVAKLVAIVGPTASGKSDLALRVAEQFGGEVICADSRTIYKGMDIGTAKPSKEDQDRVPHHLLDILEPNQSFSAAEFKALANEAIKNIHARGKLPILVGGTGLYVYAVIYDYQFPAGARSAEREALEKRPLDDLVAELRRRDPEAVDQIDLQNPRRVIRALETIGQPKTKTQKLEPNTLLLGINPGMEGLERRIAVRTKHMLVAGLIEEAKRLQYQYGDVEPLNTVGYNEVIQSVILDRKRSGSDRESFRKDPRVKPEDDIEELISLHTRQLAKRQMTWFKRNPEIKWVESVHQGIEITSQYLSSRGAAKRRGDLR